jgi:hypothetical protein
MKKFLTYRTASILGWIGFALLVTSWFLPRHTWQEWLASSLGFILVVIDLVASFHQRGYSKGLIQGARKESVRTAKAYADGYKQGAAHATGRHRPVDFRAVSDEDRCTSPNLEAELNKGLAADKADEQPTAKEHRCQSCGDLTETTFCEPSCTTEGATK